MGHMGGGNAMDEPVSAHGCSHGPVIIISAQKGASILKVRPKLVCARRGSEIRLRIVPARKKDTVTTNPHGVNPGVDAWLEGKNTGSETEIIINVLNDAELGVYKYSVTVDGVGTLDPHAEVIPN